MITVIPIFYMCLHVTTGWLAVRLVTIIRRSCLHSLKHPSFGTCQLFPLLVTFLQSPDPKAPALLGFYHSYSRLCCHTLERQETMPQHPRVTGKLWQYSICYRRDALNPLNLASFQHLNISEMINIFPGTQNTNFHHVKSPSLRIHHKNSLM